MKKYYFIIFLIFLFLPLATEGAILYLEPSGGTYNQGDIFVVEAKIDTQGEYINALGANLIFSSEVLEVRDLSRGNSILTLWIEEPEFSGGVIAFIGGVPGGYQGPDGLVGKIIFKAKNSGYARIIFQDDSKALLNDGKGTEANLIVKGVEFNIKETGGSKDEWQEELEKDKTSPQPFEVEINQDLSIFEGKYFIIFSTTDKETGVDHYEVKEGKRDWKIGISPYVLESQELFDDIWVKAIDKAGNEWIEIIKAPKKPKREYVFYIALVFVLILVIIGLVWLTAQKIRRA